MIYRYGIFPVLKAGGWAQNRVHDWLSGQAYKRDDEYVHTLALAGIKAMQRVPGLMELLEFTTKTVSEAKPRDVFGIRFPAPIGLAAGLDKEGTCLPFWQGIGFGFAEIGTVLPNKQEGNPRPRLFRLDEEEELINRMGFNSPGMTAVRNNYLRTRSRIRIPVGISLGKMKETGDEEAHLDYEAVLREFFPFADFFVANVSSPNTPGLRNLQKRELIEKFLAHLIACIAHEARRRNTPRPPLIVKVAPDLSLGELDGVIEAVLATDTNGLMIGNTTVSRPEGASQPLYSEAGGLSGSDWLFGNALSLGKYTKLQAPKLPLILVGGINSAEKAERALGVADLIEVLTGFVYQGPRLIRDIRSARTRGPLRVYEQATAA